MYDDAMFAVRYLSIYWHTRTPHIGESPSANDIDFTLIMLQWLFLELKIARACILADKFNDRKPAIECFRE